MATSAVQSRWPTCGHAATFPPSQGSAAPADRERTSGPPGVEVTWPPLSCRGRHRRTQVAWRVGVTSVSGPPYVEGAVSAESWLLWWWRRRGHSPPVPAVWRWFRRRRPQRTLLPCAVPVVAGGEGGYRERGGGECGPLVHRAVTLFSSRREGSASVELPHIDHIA